jgi:replicative DNA helicase
MNSNGQMTGERHTGNVPPNDLEAEASVLGALLLDETAVLRAVDLIGPEDFYRENNGLIYSASRSLFRRGEPIDQATLADELSGMGALERVGGRAHLALLRESVPTAANVEHYARIVRKHAMRRQLIGVGTQSIRAGYDLKLPVEDALGASATAMLSIGQSTAATVHPVAESVAEVMEHQEAIRDGGAPTGGIMSGLADLDNITNGWKPGHLVIVGARPSVGKTALGLQVAINAAQRGKAVTIFSLEMRHTDLITRAACALAGVDSKHVERNTLGDAANERWQGALSTIAELPLVIDDRPGLDEFSLLAQARRLKLQRDTGLIVVDYLGLVRGRASENRVQEVSGVVRSLFELARGLNVPVIALAQLNRGVEQRTDKRPVLSDLKEAGEIEQSADVVVLIHRTEADPESRELIVAKHRNGATGSVKVGFRSAFTRFESIERRRMEPDE